MKRWLGAVSLWMLLTVGWVLWGVWQPATLVLRVPDDLVALDTPDGQAMLARAEGVDLAPLQEAFQTQQHASYCGVASAAIALSSLGRPTSQDGVFDVRGDTVSAWAVFLGGMTLAQFDGLVRAHGVPSQVTHGDALEPDSLRTLLRQDLARAGDVVVVNYDRRTLRQRGAGHFSPVAAYDAQTDRFLVLDTASYKYPPVWVKTAALHAALATRDSASGQHRGVAQVGPLSP